MLERQVILAIHQQLLNQHSQHSHLPLIQAVQQELQELLVRLVVQEMLAIKV